MASFLIQVILNREVIDVLTTEECASLVIAIKEWLDDKPTGAESRVCFTKCILFALLLYTRSCREYFEPAVFCETNCCGWMDDSYKLPCNKTIEYWKDIEDFPILRKVKPTVEQVKILIRKVNSDSSGAFFVATAQPTYGVGIFRTRSSVEYRMLLFQPIDWMSNVSHDTVNLMAWKEFHPLLHECMWFKMNDTGGNQQTVSVKFSHIVLRASDINGIVC